MTPLQENYERRTKEANIDYWQDQGLLEGISDPHIKMVTALMLQNQKLHDDQSTPELVVKDSLKIVSKVIPNLLAHKIVSVQPKLGRNDVVFYNRYRVVEADIALVVDKDDCASKTRKFKALREDDVNPDELADKIVTEIDNEIITDLFANAGTVAPIEKDQPPEVYYNRIGELSGTVHRKTFHNWKKWVVISEDLLPTFSQIPPGHKVHVVKTPLPGLLLGMKGDEFYQSGYSWNPYIMLANSPILPESTFRPGYLIRYGKKLLREGAKNFGKITFTKKP